MPFGFIPRKAKPGLAAGFLIPRARLGARRVRPNNEANRHEWLQAHHNGGVFRNSSDQQIGLARTAVLGSELAAERIERLAIVGHRL